MFPCFKISIKCFWISESILVHFTLTTIAWLTGLTTDPTNHKVVMSWHLCPSYYPSFQAIWLQVWWYNCRIDSQTPAGHISFCSIFSWPCYILCDISSLNFMSQLSPAMLQGYRRLLLVLLGNCCLCFKLTFLLLATHLNKSHSTSLFISLPMYYWYEILLSYFKKLLNPQMSSPTNHTFPLSNVINHSNNKLRQM